MTPKEKIIYETNFRLVLKPEALVLRETLRPIYSAPAVGHRLVLILSGNRNVHLASSDARVSSR
jgi:hypothetical protein